MRITRALLTDTITTQIIYEYPDIYLSNLITRVCSLVYLLLLVV